MLFRASNCPREEKGLLAAYSEVAGAREFPCIFAPVALQGDELLFGVADVSDGSLASILKAMDDAAEAIRQDKEQVVVVWVKGLESVSLEDDAIFAGKIVREILRAGSAEWPEDAVTDPSDGEWNLWYKGVDFFINFSTGNHRLRRSRNLGGTFTMVLQSQSGFDRFPNKARGLRDKIRKRVNDYDKILYSPALGIHGESVEIDQYFLADSNRESVRILDLADKKNQGGAAQCPFSE